MIFHRVAAALAAALLLAAPARAQDALVTYKSMSPELALDPDFSDVKGEVRVFRGSGVLWSERISSGSANMCHSLSNIEHHHFKYPAHRQPGDVHIHFFGAGAFSFGAGIKL